MEFNINIEDYLSEEEIKAIVKEEFTFKIRHMFSSQYDIQRIIGNLCYEFVWDCVDKTIEGGLENKIKQKVIDIINNLCDFSIFRKKNEWNKEDSVGQQILEKAVKDNANIIVNKVKTYLENFDEEQSYILGEVVKEAIIKKLTD